MDTSQICPAGTGASRLSAVEAFVGLHGWRACIGWLADRKVVNSARRVSWAAIEGGLALARSVIDLATDPAQRTRLTAPGRRDASAPVTGYWLLIHQHRAR